jgi:hypothetical protein
VRIVSPFWRHYTTRSTIAQWPGKLFFKDSCIIICGKSKGDKMKKLLLAFVATIALTSGASAAAQGSDKIGIYAGVGMGIEVPPKDWDVGVGLVLKGGYHLDMLLKNFSVEAELGKSIVDPERPGSNNDINVLTLGAYAAYNIEIPNSPFVVRPRFGFVVPNLGDDIHSYDVSVSSGVAGLVEVTDFLDIFVDYTLVSETISTFSGGVEFKF